MNRHHLDSSEPKRAKLKCCLCSRETKLIILSDDLETLIPQLLSVQLQIPGKNERYLICSTCYDSINEFENFKKRIRKIQRRSGAQEVQEEDTSKCNVWKPDSDTELHKKTINPKDTPVTVSTSYEESEELKFISESDAKLIQANTVYESYVKSESAKNEIQLPPVDKKNENTFKKPTSSIFVCDQCQYQSYRPKDFSRHIRSHRQLTYRHRICSLCSHVCNSVSELFAHRKEMHPESARSLKSQRNFRCKTCNQNFIDKITHQKHQCRGKPFKCPWKCGRQFETNPEVKRHRRFCRPGSTIYTCSRCKKKLRNLQSLKNHDKRCAVRYKPAHPDQNAVRIKKTQDEKRLTKETAQPVQSSEEEESCNEEKTSVENVGRKTAGSFKCKKCCKEFQTVSALGLHFTNCHGDYSNAKKCFCGKFFFTEKSLEFHKLAVHPISATAQPKRKDSSESSSSESDSSNDNASNKLAVHRISATAQPKRKDSSESSSSESDSSNDNASNKLAVHRISATAQPKRKDSSESSSSESNSSNDDASNKLAVHHISATTQPERKDSSESSSSESDSSNDDASDKSKSVPITVSSEFTRNEVDAKSGSRFPLPGRAKSM